jgi:hypothetical protein
VATLVGQWLAAGEELMELEDPFNCPKCGAHDYGLYRAAMQGCPHCLSAENKRLRADLLFEQGSIAALLDERERLKADVEMIKEMVLTHRDRLTALCAGLDASLALRRVIAGECEHGLKRYQCGLCHDATERQR